MSTQSPHDLYDIELASFFTDVEDLQYYFKDAVLAPKLDKRLLVVHGVGGIGKTSLLRMFRLHCRKLKTPFALSSGDDVKSLVDILVSWDRDLVIEGLKLENFRKSREQYRIIQAKVEEQGLKMRESRARAIGSVGKVAAKTIVEAAASTIPVIGPIASALGGAGTDALIDWLRGFLTKPELDLILSPSEKLMTTFLKDVNKLADKKRLVLAIDTYEQLAFIEDEIRVLVQQLNPNILLVVSGRNMPNWTRAWPGWMSQAKVRELEPMSPEIMRALIKNYYGFICGGDLEPKQVEAIIRFSRGLPMVVNSAVTLFTTYGVRDFHSIQAGVIDSLVDRLREGVPEGVYPDLEAASTLRWFNKGLLRAVLDREDVDDFHEKLKRFPFVRPRGQALMIHDAVREIMDEHLRINDLQRYQLLHDRASAFFEQEIKKAGKDKWNTPILEMLHHRLRSNESNGILLLESIFAEAELSGQNELIQSILTEASNHNFTDEENSYKVEFLKGRTIRDWMKSEAHYKDLLENNLDDRLRIKVLRALADPLAYQGKSNEGYGYLLEGLEICNVLGDAVEAAWTRLELCWLAKDPAEKKKHIDLAIDAFKEADDDNGLSLAELQLGWYLLNQWEAPDGRSAFMRSLSLQEKSGNKRMVAFIKERIGQTYLIEGDLAQAIEFKEKALKVFDDLQDSWNIAWTLDELASCYIPMGRLEAALAGLKRAQEIFSSWNDHRETACAARMGTVYRHQGRLELAYNTYQRAKLLPAHNDWTQSEIYGGLGSIYLARREFDDAIANYQKMAEGFRHEGKEHEATMVSDTRLGDLEIVRGNSLKATDHYQKSLLAAKTLRNQPYQCRSLFGIYLAHFQIGDFDEFEDVLSEAENIGQRFEYYNRLARIYLLRGHIAWIRGPDNKPGFESAFEYYKKSLVHALRHNRFVLDALLNTRTVTQPLTPIVSFCHERGEPGKRMLQQIGEWWRNGINDTGISRPVTSCPIPVGIPLLDAETFARTHEPGDGNPQTTTLERLDQALRQP